MRSLGDSKKIMGKDLWLCLTVGMLYFRLEMSSQGDGTGSWCGSGANAKPICEILREFISSEVSRYLSETVDERLATFRTEVMAIIGACT